MPDLSLYPQSHLAKHAMDNAVGYGQAHKADIEEMLAIADLSLTSFADAKPKIAKALTSSEPMHRYWAAMVCTAHGESAKSLVDSVQPLLNDESEVVRIRAAEFLGLVGAINPQQTLTNLVNTTKDAVVATEALNSVVWFRDFFDDRYPVKRSDFHPISSGADIDDRLNYINGVPYPPKAKGKRGKKKKAA